MSTKKFTWMYLSLVMLGIIGIWLGYRAFESTNIPFWLGPLIVLCAVSSLILVFRRDLRCPTEREKIARWKRAAADGKGRFVVRQILFGQLALLPLLATDLFSSYRRDESWNPKSLLLMSAIMVGGIAISSLAWWHFQQRRYENAA